MSRSSLTPRQRVVLAEIRRQSDTGERNIYRKIVRRLAWRHYRWQLLASWAIAFGAGLVVGVIL